MYAIAIIRYRKPLEDVLKHVDAHAYCQGLKQEGLLLASGPWRHAAAEHCSCGFRMTKPRRRSTVFARTTVHPVRLAQYEMWPWAPALGAEDLDRL